MLLKGDNILLYSINVFYIPFLLQWFILLNKNFIILFDDYNSEYTSHTLINDFN